MIKPTAYQFQLGLTGLALVTLLACGGTYRNEGETGPAGSTGGASAGNGSGSAGQGVMPFGGMSGGVAGSTTTPSAGSGSTQPTDRCVYNGSTYLVGQSFPDSDGCNSCTCLRGGDVGCTERGCVSCTYAGAVYPVGQGFPSRDGCNQCECLLDGSVRCSLEACVCNPPQEWWRKYYSANAGTCKVSDFSCPTSTTSFSNGCGCGCEEQDSCAEYAGCGLGSGCDEPALHAACPYLIIAE